MTVTQRDGHSFGEDQRDIRAGILSCIGPNGDLPTEFADCRCGCGSTVFALALDDEEGAAVRVCSQCSEEHAIGDSADYLEDAELEQCACPCGAESFEITVGVALYAESEDVKWLYVGCRCPRCGLLGIYGDWKNEFEDFRVLLKSV